MKTINVLGIDVKYMIEDNNRQKLLFIHGYESSSKLVGSIWKENREYDIVTLDLPGNGETEYNHEVSLEFYAEVVSNFIKKLNLDDVIIVGHSMGGAIAMMIGHMKEVKQIILINPLNPFSLESTLKEMNAKNLMEAIKKAVKAIKEKPGATSLLNLSLRYKNMNKYVVNKQFLSKSWQDSILWYAYNSNQHKTVGISTMDDKIVLPRSIEMVEDEFDIKFIKLDEGGHSPLYENSMIFNELIQNLIK